MADIAAPTARKEWRQYGALALTAGVGFSFASFMSPAMGLFMAPLQNEFGWGRTLLSSGSAIGAALSLLLSPLFGALVDRLGARRLAIIGLVATSLTIAGFSTLNGAPIGWIGLWFAFGIASMTIHATTWTTAVAGVFETSKGLAIGVTLSGSAAASAIVPPLADWLITNEGWRAAYVWMGLGWGGLALVLCLLFLFDAHDRRRSSANTQCGSASAATLPGLTIAEARRDSSLWRVALATYLILTITIGITVHQVPIIVSTGVSRTNAAWLASVAGIAGIVGKVVTGTLLDRFHVRWTGGLTLASTAIAYPLLLEPLRAPTLIVIAMLINGYAAGTKLQLCGYLTARYAGMRNYGAIFGFMASLVALAGGTGPLLAGFVFDQTGNYDLFLIAGTFISVISGALIFSLGRYPNWTVPEHHTRDTETKWATAEPAKLS